VNGGTTNLASVNYAGFTINGNGSLPVIMSVASGQNGWLLTQVSGLRQWGDGVNAGGDWYVYDMSGGHTHLYCKYSNNHIMLNETTVVVADFPGWGAGQLETSTVSGVVVDGLGSTTNVTGYTAANLDVGNANSYMCFFTKNQRAAAVGSITTDGNSTFYNTTSDGRHKKNLRPLTEDIDVGKMIDAIEPVAFEWTDPDEPTGHGFVAQDLAEVAPQAVWAGYKNLIDTEEFPHPWGVDFSKLVPYMIAEMQALRKRVAELETKHG